jgi:ComF family protein
VGEASICAGCLLDMPWHESPVSPAADVFERSLAMLHYSFPIDVAIKALKFKRRLYYAPALAELLATARPLLPGDIDAVLPVPLHWRRKALRGFNQAMELAQPLARSLSLPLLRNVRRTRATPFQSGLDAAERTRNLRCAFVLRRACKRAHILIVDDVITTGATTRALAKLLLASGVTKVSVLAVARAGHAATGTKRLPG